MTDFHGVRGTGVRFTLRYVPRFSGLWLLVCVLTLVVFALTSYLGLVNSLGPAGRSRLLLVLILQTICVILGMVALAVFTTHRLAGPLVALLRAFQDVKAGDLDRQLRFRQSDRHLAELEKSFNEMMAAVRQRLDDERSPGHVAGGESA
ncbi:MAG TPA: methyl-accepting chemotaxis protein [Thermoanaerobaculia bacterium]|nr:methyl-accepting chemotaxis protein [Thermoanaerobaculia bacterium]